MVLRYTKENVLKKRRDIMAKKKQNREVEREGKEKQRQTRPLKNRNKGEEKITRTGN
jgi:hypothetical protein